ncbi:hypothetical protein RCL_jg20073.t1 [Rhizophagus clarus]|uniref:Uncharacterized protein n=1 Tax=Rhizophagus clarus TaxID=94130 RepID=A0A8H3L9L9_9GLOM|nr:hypothetical protein RCL_jg20073.t1 [Rhizophagus clarus]
MNTTDNLGQALFSLKDNSDFKNFKRNTFSLDLNFRFRFRQLEFQMERLFLGLELQIFNLDWNKYFSLTPRGINTFAGSYRSDDGLNRFHQSIPLPKRINFRFWSQFQIWAINTSSFRYFGIGFLISILGYLKCQNISLNIYGCGFWQQFFRVFGYTEYLDLVGSLRHAEFSNTRYHSSRKKLRSAEEAREDRN